MRERMEEHRKNPACAELPQADGSDRPLARELRRASAGGATPTAASKINASSTLWDGTEVSGPAGLRQAIVSRPEQFARTTTEMLLTYALGRGLEYSDMPVVRAIVRDAARRDYRFSSLVTGIVDQRAVSDEIGEVERTSESCEPSTRLRGPRAEAFDRWFDARTPRRRCDVHHQEAPVAPRVHSRRCRCDDRAAVPRCDGARADAARQNSGRAGPALRLHLRPARLDHEGLDAGAGRRRLRVLADPQAARAVPRSPDGADEPLQQRRERPLRRAPRCG